MNEPGNSDRLIVPEKRSNKALAAAEIVEGSGLTKGNADQQNTHRTQSRGSVPSALERIREIARKDKKKRFTNLFHHVSNPTHLEEAFFALKRDASAGIDGETWDHYKEKLEDNLQNLRQRLQRGGYRAKPVRRVYIPKADGKLRPLGVPTLEDKIVQRATVDVLNAIFEQDFAGFSYGFRPGRNQHKALKALGDGFIYKVSFVLDADIRGFFDTINHEWLIRFVEHRIGDQRVVRLVRKWLAAGVLEDGKRLPSAVGTPQGGSISPLLANIYLHYSLDLWVQWWRKQPGRGKVAFVRYADDFVVGFQLKGEADEFLRQLKERLAKFQLDLHPEKTRLIEFGPFAAMTRQKRGQGKPETFNFLGFTHICGKTQKGKFTIWRQTERKRMTAKLKALRLELRRRMHQKIPQVGKWLEAVLRGHYQYYGVSYNFRAIQNFRYQLSLAWFKTLRRRSQRHRTNWERMRRLIHKWLPAPRIVHSIFPGNQTAYPR